MNAYSGQVKRPCIILITGYPDAMSAQAFDRILRTETPRLGYWLDTFDLTVAETVDAILSHVAQATVMEG